MSDDDKIVTVVPSGDIQYPCGDIWEPVFPDRRCVVCDDGLLERLMRHHGDGTSVGPLEMRCSECKLVYSIL